MNNDRVSIIIPAYNEAEAIEMVLKELLLETAKWEEEMVEIVVVNDGSSDETAKIVDNIEGVRLINHRRNKGYGAALKTGIKEAHGDIIAWYDADGQHRPEDLRKVISKMKAENLDYCIGIRDKDSYEEKSRRLGKKILKCILNLIIREELKDFNSGMRGFRKEVILPYLPLLPNTFGASTVTTLLMLEQEYNGGEVSITALKRKGKSSVKQIRDGFRTIVLILQVILLFQPMRILGKAGIIMCVAGGIYGIFRALQWSNGIPILASILVIFGFQLICFGVLSDQISKICKQVYEQRYIYPK
ncbi:MAG: glycosyltransferase family 2 protein [Lachnospiraceae bacterium]|nr:glycosyltransferase family 2 protein [Lachnospiraceae bacterium]GFI04090.1 undecaprenyl-phosphate 4-deoxy-4-formamido-L-arabinose transferase [Lachnospiraceae bacterium]